MSKVKESACEIALQVAAKLNVRLVDVEYVKKQNGMNLTIFIDKEGGITLDDTTKFSQIISEIFDEVDITAGAQYTLNVSSPGIDRKFKTTEDFKAALKKEVEIKLYAPLENKKEFCGVLTNVNNEFAEIECNGQILKIAREKIASAGYKIKF